MLLALNPPLPVLADGPYDVSTGDITITVDNNGQTSVNGAVQTSAVIITSNGVETSHTVTITAAAGQTANVTFRDLNIDVSSNYPYVAAVTTTGNVTIELDGENTLKSGIHHAGLEKNVSGTLTIKDGIGTPEGSLNATGLGGGSRDWRR